MATRKAADSTTRNAPSILSTGRLSAFRPASHRTSRDIRRVPPRTLTFMIIARGRYGRVGGGRGGGGPGPGLIEGIALRDSWKAHRGWAGRCAAGVPSGG